jgi:hypothetical protein
MTYNDLYSERKVKKMRVLMERALARMQLTLKWNIWNTFIMNIEQNVEI